ncbi:MAG: flagellar hook-associated protein FlgK [Pseudomonadota bacterium]|uniref:Flagellar hook-associated protein 1 n=1 Tax=Gallaecimonas pentaromativorans TaxID=584787 RepID=A0A3N1PG86_9GAMM|nr:flagellar hook-associated protein FlgK [Gallaecimonas pentaromativorans]MED5526542.1 flagellar hook-associated protein FlgK [Pseudomonadota bacterium]ROQ25880.1 flagellar hook-associated protein 1 FlgK [Gallaecimonas pentaromativorans]
MSMLNNGLSGLQASQYSLNVVSQNIANINTPGYSRQEALLSARNGGGFGTSSAGDGVEVSSLRRVSDGYLNAALWRATSQSGYDSQFQTMIGQMESVFGSDELSISNGLDSFFSALSAASSSPQSIAPRQQILATAQALANRFNQLSSNLDVQEKQLDEQADATVTDINTQAQSIAKINQSIIEVKAKGGNTSALEDQRDELVLALSKEVSVKTSNQADGSITLSLAGGQPLVMGSRSATLSRSGDDINLKFVNDSFTLSDVGGSLGANRDYKTGELNDLRTSLNGQAQNLADSINSQLAAGFDLNGNPGTALFSYDPTSPAGSLAVDSSMTPENLAFIGDDGTGNPVGGSGDNSNLGVIVEMKAGFYDDYSKLVGDLAVSSGQAQSLATASDSLRLDAQSKRDSVSGVNQDEEAAKLMQYMQAYQANAKVISTADNVFSTLMGMF